jgi:hypothetical protein
MIDPNGDLLIKLQVILKSQKDEQRRKANEWLGSLQHNPEKQTALKHCLKAFGIPFEKSEEVILRAAPIFPAMPPSLYSRFRNAMQNKRLVLKEFQSVFDAIRQVANLIRCIIKCK